MEGSLLICDPTASRVVVSRGEVRQTSIPISAALRVGLEQSFAGMSIFHYA